MRRYGNSRDTTDTNKTPWENLFSAVPARYHFAVNKACESDPKKLAAAIDFCWFMSSPRCTEARRGISRFPFPQAQLPDRLSGFIITGTAPPCLLARVNSELRDFFCRGDQMYLEEPMIPMHLHNMCRIRSSIRPPSKAEKGGAPIITTGWIRSNRVKLQLRPHNTGRYGE